MQVVRPHEILHGIGIDGRCGTYREMVVGSLRHVAPILYRPDGDDAPLRQIVAIPDPQASVSGETMGGHRGGEGLQFGHGKQDRRLARRGEEAPADSREIVEGEGLRMTCGPFDGIGRRRLILEEGRIAEDVIVVSVASDGPCPDVRAMYGDTLSVVGRCDVVHGIGIRSFIDVDGVDACIRESVGGHEGQQSRTGTDIDDRRCTVERRPCTEDAGILRDLHRCAMLVDGEGAHGEETGRHGRASDGRGNESRN